jgi:antitoxin component YwqK of YwqJK toxin-antitoxin module
MTILKKIIALTFIFIFAQNFFAQKKTPINSKKTVLMIPLVNKEFEKFNFEKFNSRKDKTPYSEFTETLKNGTIITMSETNAGKSYSEIASDSYFQISKGYYPNGNIKTKGLFFNGSGFQKGIWYEFDEKGKLISEIDYDKPYKFTFEDLLIFCKKENIVLKKGFINQSSFNTNIFKKKTSSNEIIWVIEWQDPNLLTHEDTTCSKGTRTYNVLFETLEIDGITGVLIKRYPNK